ncbi:hypothetical protein GQX74_013970 [Glossina fuscipes]|nr:hypothetical protein GQX74_013970 [Glossina fuscipes]
MNFHRNEQKQDTAAYEAILTYVYVLRFYEHLHEDVLTYENFSKENLSTVRLALLGLLHCLWNLPSTTSCTSLKSDRPFQFSLKSLTVHVPVEFTTRRRANVQEAGTICMAV